MIRYAALHLILAVVGAFGIVCVPSLAQASLVEVRLTFIVDEVDKSPQYPADLALAPNISVGDRLHGSLRVDDDVFTRAETRLGVPAQVRDVLFRLGDAVYDQNRPVVRSYGPVVDVNLLELMRSGCYYGPGAFEYCTPDELAQFNGTYSDIWGFDFAGDSRQLQAIYGAIAGPADDYSLGLYGDWFSANVLMLVPVELVGCHPDDCGKGYLAPVDLRISGRLHVRIPEPRPLTLIAAALIGFGFLRMRRQKAALRDSGQPVSA